MGKKLIKFIKLIEFGIDYGPFGLLTIVTRFKLNRTKISVPKIIFPRRSLPAFILCRSGFKRFFINPFLMHPGKVS